MLDLKNRKFGSLTALSIAGRDARNRLIWKCLCDCGNYKNVASRHLVNTATQSCGCRVRANSALNGKAGAHKISGPLSHLWKSDLTEAQRNYVRDKIKLKEWRIKVFERDNYTCDICKVKGRHLEAHHLNSYSAYPEERFLIENGITLCGNHHVDFHMSLGGIRIVCTKSDYEKFKSNLVSSR